MKDFFKKIKYILTVIVSIGITLLFLYGWEWFPKNSWFDLQTVGIWVGSIGTIVAIIFVIKNTGKQINNQNKESHRPYLRVISIEEIANDLSIDSEREITKHNEFIQKHDIFNLPTFYTGKKDDSTKIIRKNICFSLDLKNIGYGIAHSIEFLGIINTAFFANKSGFKGGDYFSTFDMAKGAVEILKMNISCLLRENEFADKDGITFLIFYSDLQGNVYSQYVDINLFINPNKSEERKIVFSFTVFTQNSSSFCKVLKDNNVNYEDKIQIYREIYLGEK